MATPAASANATSVASSSAGGHQQHHQHHEHSGYSAYSPLSTLERQYAEPVGRRLFLFVRTNPNVYLAGGVESVIKASHGTSPKMSTASTVADSTATSSTTEFTESVADSSNNVDASVQASSSTDNNNAADPFSFLGEEEGGGGGADDGHKKKGHNIGRFFKKAAKTTTKALQQGITHLAIKADGGKSPDVLVVGLYDPNNTDKDNNPNNVLGFTESLSVPMDETKKFQGMRFCVPLVLPGSLPDAGHVIVKVWIRSGASMLSHRHYLIGEAPLSVQQLRAAVAASTAGAGSFMTLTLQSNMVADGKLFVCVTPDSKFPQLCGPGWSLADPDSRTAYGGAMFHWPLDQAYGMNYPPSPTASWLIATERSVESAVVLPVAAAFAKLTAQAARISMQHAESLSMRVHAARHDSTIGDYVDCTVTIGHLTIAAATEGAAAETHTTAYCSASWQRPDSIFEVDLLQPVRVPTAPSSDARSSLSFRFFPKPVTENILPALLQASGGKMPVSTGFFLGAVRLQVAVSRPHKDNMTPVNSGGGGGGDVETWECSIGLEDILAQQSAPETNTPVALEFPVLSTATKRQMGTVSLSLLLKRKNGPPVPQRVDAKGGLLSLLGLTPICDSVQPHLDTVQPEEGTPAATLSRQQQQLDTMGMFATFGYTNYHCKTIRTADVKELEERARQYNAALTTPETEVVPANEDRKPKPFRPSSSRSEFLLAGLPFNVHTASLSLHVLEQTATGTETKVGGVFCNTTCGAPADHAREFGNIFPKSKDTNVQQIGLTSPVDHVSGGLRRLEQKRAEIAKHVSDLQVTLTMQVANFFNAERQNNKNPINHVPSRHAELQTLRWNLFEAVQSLHHVTWHCAMRRSSSFSQALGTALTSFLASLSDPLKWQSTWPELWAKHGYLVTYEGLLTSAGKELHMIEDASVGISMLRYVSVVFRPEDDQQPDAEKVPVLASPYLKWIRLNATHSGLTGTNPEFVLELGVVRSYFDQRIPQVLRNGRPVRFCPLLFEVGVDIRQWGAHTGKNMMKKSSKNENDGSNTEKPEVSILDDEDDEGGFSDDDVLVQINYEAYNKLNAYAHLISPANSPSSAQKIHPLLEKLYQNIVTSSGKISHEILDEAAALSQQLGGGGIVFCKSGKDRTAMHVTYKQAQYANRFRQTHPSQVSGDGNGSPFEDSTLSDANTMRIYGTRLPICEKNVGQAKYAFNSLQVKFMPDALKPPSNTLAGFLKGGKVFQGGGIES